MKKQDLENLEDYRSMQVAKVGAWIKENSLLYREHRLSKADEDSLISRRLRAHREKARLLHVSMQAFDDVSSAMKVLNLKDTWSHVG